jgi:DNA-binding beta-propeller fold protein YncE
MRLQFAWAIFRFPLLLFIAFLLRHQLIEVTLAVFGIDKITRMAIDVLSTPLTRFFFVLAMATLLSICAILTRHLNLTKAYAVMCGAGILIILVAVRLTGKSYVFALPGIILLATNLLPANLWLKMPVTTNLRSLLRIGVCFTEVFLFWLHARWVSWLQTTNECNIRTRWLWAIPGITMASVVTALFIGGQRLVPIEQAIRSPSSVRIVARGEYNWIKVDKTHRALYAVGHGFDHLRMFDLSDWSKAPLESVATTGWSQSFEYSPAANELYVYNSEAQRLRFFDSRTLAMTRDLDIGKVSLGDTWLAADDATNTITVVSEADEEVGDPFVVVNRSTGMVLDHQKEEAGNLILDPSTSLLYLSYFRRQSRVSIYDLKKRAFIKSAPIGPRAERMALWKAQSKVLITLPPDSKIAEADQETLDVERYLPAKFGVRAIAIDQSENLLFDGSIVTGEMEIVDLSTMKRRASYYLGPWLRTIELIPDAGIAYVSSNGAIYEVKYK